MGVNTNLIVALLCMTTGSMALPSESLSDRQTSSSAENCTNNIARPYKAVNNPALPDPFTFAGGAKVTTLSDFACRQSEISAIFQQFELGTLPGPPDSLSAAASGSGSSSIAINVTVGKASAAFSVSITWPKTIPSNGLVPAMIGVGGVGVPLPDGIATVTFNNDNFAQENSGSSRGIGLFYNLFGSGHSAGATTAWAWGLSRVIDAIESVAAAGNATRSAKSPVLDPSRLGVTGCSRDGKGAFIAGALEPRFALTVPQESGSGGAACWRISDYDLSIGMNVQTSQEIVGENVWFSPNFNSYATSINTVPEDHHLLPALIAPRGLFVIENDIDWLGPNSTTGCMKAGRMIYEAVGQPTNMGFSLVGNHAHCSFPSAQQADLWTYIDHFLLNGAAPSVVEVSPFYVNMSQWVTWTVPTLTSG